MRRGNAREIGAVLEGVREKAASSPPKSPHGKCKHCDAPVLWATLPDGRRPVDPDPNPAGNVVLWKRPDGTLHGQYLHEGDAQPEGTTLRSSHFKTCPRGR